MDGIHTCMGIFLLFAETANLQRSKPSSSKISPISFVTIVFITLQFLLNMLLHLLHTHTHTAITNQMSFAIVWIDTP